MDAKLEYIGEVSTKCSVCASPVDGMTVSLEEFLSNAGFKIGARLGHRCGACGAVSCAGCKGKGIGFHWWFGYDRASCRACRAPFDRQHSSALIIVPIQSRSPTATSSQVDPAREFVLRDVLVDSGDLGDLFVQASGLSFVSYGSGVSGVATQDLLYTAGFGLMGRALGAGDVAKRQAFNDRMHEQTLARRADYGLSITERVQKRPGSFVIPRGEIAECMVHVERIKLVDQDCLVVALKANASPRRLVQVQSSRIVADALGPIKRLLQNLVDGSLAPGLDHDAEWGFGLGRTTGSQVVNQLVTGDLAAATQAMQGGALGAAFRVEFRESINGLSADQLNSLVANIAGASPTVQGLVREELANAVRLHVPLWITTCMVVGGVAGIVVSLQFKDALGGWFWALIILSAFVLFGTRETIPSTARRIHLRHQLARCGATLDS